jgi:hypothetical protein
MVLLRSINLNLSLLQSFADVFGLCDLLVSVRFLSFFPVFLFFDFLVRCIIVLLGVFSPSAPFTLYDQIPTLCSLCSYHSQVTLSSDYFFSALLLLITPRVFDVMNLIAVSGGFWLGPGTANWTTCYPHPDNPVPSRGPRACRRTSCAEVRLGSGCAVAVVYVNECINNFHHVETRE